MIYYTIKFVRKDENNRPVFEAEPIDGCVEKDDTYFNVAKQRMESHQTPNIGE